MNDLSFTKDELEMILEDTEHEIAIYRMANSPTMLRFRDKVKRMIDNYCEHEWENYYAGSIIQGIYCQKCNTKLKGS